MIKILYISSPFSGPTEHDIQVNILEAERIAIDAIAAGWGVLCPHKNSSSLQHLGLPNQYWYDMDLELLKRCDAVIFNCCNVQKEQNSKGMDLEDNFAMDNFIPSIYADIDIKTKEQRYELVTIKVGIWHWLSFDHFPTPEDVFGGENLK